MVETVVIGLVCFLGGFFYGLFVEGEPVSPQDACEDEWICNYCGTEGLEEFERCPNCGAL